MNSPHQREQLPDLLSDALEPAERARVESHLAECAQCAGELRALQNMQQTLAALPAATPPADLRADVRAALLADAKPARRWALPAPRGADKRETEREADSAGRPLRDSERIGARRVLPFALPARPLAWGGAVAVGAVGLMLLARPSLQNAPDETAPLSETELAARADQSAGASAGNVKNPQNAQNSEKKPATGSAAPKTKGGIEPKSANSGTANSPAPKDNLPPLPAPPIPNFRVSPPTISRPETLAPPVNKSTPSFDLFPEIAPKIAPGIAPKIARKENAKQSGVGGAASAVARQAPALTKPNSTKQPEPARALPRAPVGQRNAAPPQKLTPPPQAPHAAESEGDSAALPGQAGVSSESARDFATESAPLTAGRAAPPPKRVLPALPRDSASRQRSAFAAPEFAENSPDWAGGAVSAQLRRSGDKTPVLSLSVGLAIGNARLSLLLPGGQTQIWRGSLNAAPIEIKLPDLAGKMRSGQKVRARLEQIDGAGNPKGSTTFDLLWP